MANFKANFGSEHNLYMQMVACIVQMASSYWLSKFPWSSPRMCVCGVCSQIKRHKARKATTVCIVCTVPNKAYFLPVCVGPRLCTEDDDEEHPRQAIGVLNFAFPHYCTFDIYDMMALCGHIYIYIYIYIYMCVCVCVCVCVCGSI
jgi:hypothetical protein